jgi:serine/threonine-protein kinase RsbW
LASFPDKETDQFRVQLKADSTSARKGRALVSEALASWEQERWGDAARLCASELITNVILHTRANDCELLVTRRQDHLQIFVHYEAPRAPHRQRRSREDRRPTADHGRGMRIVDALANEWGVIENEVGGSSWARIRTDE